MGQLYVVVNRGLDCEQIREVNQAELCIGRQSDCYLFLPDGFVSRRHALLTASADEVRIRDLGSRNGTLINGRLISSEETINFNSKIQIGPYSLILCADKASALRMAVGEDSTQSGARNTMSKKRRCGELILTPAQQRVYELLLEGCIEKEVALRLNISTNTVHHHAKAIYKAFSVSTRGELIAQWANDGSRQT